jgi:hypothetical protein
VSAVSAVSAVRVTVARGLGLGSALGFLTPRGVSLKTIHRSVYRFERTIGFLPPPCGWGGEEP